MSENSSSPNINETEKAPVKTETAAPKEVKVESKRSTKSAKKGATAKIAVGRRKEAVSRVRLVKGTGEITINGKPVNVYFSRDVDRNKVRQPLTLLGVDKTTDVFVNVYGGGTTGQSEAIRLGISRLLHDQSADFHKKLKDQGYLTRDSRMVERKKYGLHKARRASQFSKR
jgi:small subunit ribosomal protein S9